MDVSLKNYRTVLPQGLLKKAGKNIVRECDEIEKGCFQAYVDEGNTSFDVSITINDEGEIKGHSCDCSSKAKFCAHKASLLLLMVKGKKNTGIKKSKTKANIFEILVDEADPEKLKTWVKDILTRNKDLELAFRHQFSGQQKIYTPADIKQITSDAVKAVVKSRTKLEVGEVKKIVDLWVELHVPFITQYVNHVTDENAFLNFDALIEACEETQMKINTTSNKVGKYLETVLLKVVEPIQNLLDEDAWNYATGFFINRIYKNATTIRISYLFLLINIFDVSNTDRKKRLAGILAKQYAAAKLKLLYNAEIYTDIIFKIVKTSDLFGEFYKIFQPVRFRNNYNVELISLLIKHNYLRLAEKYCEEQIRGNYRQEYNLPYLQLLKQVYTIEGDNKKLSEVLKELFPLTFDFDDYLFISAQIANEEDKKKWRTKMLAKARHMNAYNVSAITFAFSLMAHEKKYTKMLEYINSYTPYSIINKYAANMALTAKMDFLKRIVNKDESFGFRSEAMIEEDNNVFPELLDTLLKYYSKTEIKTVLKAAENSGRFNRVSRFAVFIVKNLA